MSPTRSPAAGAATCCRAASSNTLRTGPPCRTRLPGRSHRGGRSRHRRVSGAQARRWRASRVSCPWSTSRSPPCTNRWWKLLGSCSAGRAQLRTQRAAGAQGISRGGLVGSGGRLGANCPALSCPVGYPYPTAPGIDPSATEPASCAWSRWFWSAYANANAVNAFSTLALVPR